MTIKKLRRTERAYLHAVSDGDKRAARRALRRLSRALCLLAVMAGLAGCNAAVTGLGSPPMGDGGQATADGSTLDVDAGTPALDASAVALDAALDAGPPATTDSGAPALDAGAPALDAGPPCPGAALDGHCYVSAPWDGLTGGACPAGSALAWWTDSAGQDRAAAAVGALGLGQASTDLVWVGSWAWADHSGAPALRWAVAPRSTDHAPWLQADGMHASYRSDVRWLLCEVSP